MKKNSFTNINIVSTGAYIPTKKVKNEYFIEHFEKQGIKVDGLLKAMDKEERFFTEDGENSLNMAHSAALDAMDNGNVHRSELDMVVFVSPEPEYLNPTTSMILRNRLKAQNVHVVFDLNDTCLGGVTAIDVVCNYMRGKREIKTALIAIAQNISPVVDQNDTIAYSLMSDCGVCLILRKEEENKQRGFINSVSYCRGAFPGNIRFPACGLSKALSNQKQYFPIREKNFRWDGFAIDWMGKDFGHAIGLMLYKTDLEEKDIDHCFMSQFSKRAVEEGLELEGFPLEKNYYNGHIYGYTGPCSPILALHCGIEDGTLKRGQKFLMGSVGTGIDYTMCIFDY